MDCSFSRALDAIYAAAAGPSLWPIALQRIADCFGDVGSLLIYRRHDGRLGTIVSPSLDECAAAYQRDWWQHDIRHFRVLDYGYRSNAGAITDRHVVTEEEMATHPIYTEFLRPFGLGWAASVQVAPESGTEVGLSVQRTFSKPPFSDEDLQALASIGRHVELAMRLSLRLVDAELVGLGLGDALSKLSVAAFVIDATASILFSNAKAQALLAGVFASTQGVLKFRSAESQKRFADMLRLTAGLHDRLQGNDDADRSRMIVTRDGDTTRAVYVLPMAGSSEFDGPVNGEARNIVLVVDLVPGQPVDPSLVRDVYGLTLGESRIASLVGAGISPQDAAIRLSVAESTVRSALKRVYSKLDISRQGELTTLLSQLKIAEYCTPTRR